MPELEPTATRTSPPASANQCEELPDTDSSSHRTVNLVGDGRITVDLGTPIDARIRLVTDSQRGRVSRKQLLICGVNDGAILRRLRNGRLECVHPGVYGAPHTSEVSFAAETAALLTCGEDTVLSHHSAVTLWELRPGIARPVHVTIPGDRGFPVPAGVKPHRSRTLAPSDIRVHRGLPVTSPARALLDAAAGLPDRDVERLLDEALFARRLVTLAEIGDLVARCGRHPGRARLKRVASAHDGSTSTDSPPEETMLGLIRAGGLPGPRLQVDVLGYRLDFLWPALGLAIEVDTYGTHGSPARFEADRRRDARLLTEKGISVLRLTKHGIEQRPYEALAVVARVVGQREVAARGG